MYQKHFLIDAKLEVICGVASQSYYLSKIVNGMPKNPYFRFKQFTVYQERAAMKVCTDACVLGAYAAVSEAQTILDIGAGTGLLSLMLAQRAQPNAQIHAVELEHDACAQACDNIAQSPWVSQISLFHTSIQAFVPPPPLTHYDLIVSNPPFFSKHLPSKATPRRMALHDDTLSLPDLAAAVGRLLSREGRFYLLLPPHPTQLFAQAAAAFGLHLQAELQLKHHPQADKVFRHISTWGFAQPAQTLVPSQLCLHPSTDTRLYTEAFRYLLQPYYLIFG